MNVNLKITIVLIGLATTIIGLALIYQDFAVNKVRILPISLFAVGVFSSYKVLAKTNHKSRRFKIKKFEDED